MQPTKFIFRFFVLSASLAPLSSSYAQDVCEAFAKYGIYDTRTSTSDTSKADSFRTWFCQNKFETKQAADSVGARLGYGSFSLGYNSNSDKWSEFSSNYCRDDTSNSRYRQATFDYVRSINENASNNMRACFERGGLHSRIIPGAGSDTFYVEAKLVPTGTIVKARVNEFSVLGATCRGPLEKGYEITASGVENVCRRNGNQAVDVSLSATEKVNWDTPRGLSRIPVVVPTIQTNYEIIDKQPHTYSFTFVVVLDGDRIWISLKEPCGGFLDGRNYGFYLSKSKTEAQIPSVPGCGVYAFGKVRLREYPGVRNTYIYFDGGLHTTDGTEVAITDKAVGRVDRLLK